MTTACTRFAPMLGARPGELSEVEAHELAEHLAGCDGCQARLADAVTVGTMLGEALTAEANRRDFAAFSDGVLERIPEYRRALRQAESPRPAGASTDRPRAPRGFLAWVRHHRAATAMGALAPALAALALVVYVGRSSAPVEEARLQVSAEGHGAMVLDTSDGPVVLFGDDDSAGT